MGQVALLQKDASVSSSFQAPVRIIVSAYNFGGWGAKLQHHNAEKSCPFGSFASCVTVTEVTGSLQETAVNLSLNSK